MPTTKKPKKNTENVSQKKRESNAKSQFVRDLLIRGEAVKSSKDDKLPPGATHIIAEDSDEENPRVERERFSIY